MRSGDCYTLWMASNTRRSSNRQPFILGRDAFEKISAVEGITPTAEARRRTAEFERKGLSPEERIRAIIDAHRPKP